MKQTRRQFLANASVASAAIGITGISNVSNPLPSTNNGFGLKIYATRWGFKGSMDAFCKQVKAEGYDGVEDWFPGDETREAFFEAMDKYNLSYGALVGSSGSSFEDYRDSYSSNLEKAISIKPDFINSHAGRDFITADQSKELINLGIEKSKVSGIPVYQETHRGRMLFAPHICRYFLDVVPELRITLDISHWCVVAESLLGNQEEAVSIALNRTDHIHARIGHEEGPQVPEPRAPEWKKATNAHFEWWDKVVAIKKEADVPLTVTTEFGPANYMWTTPYTRQPVADQWEINVYMMNEWRKRYL